MCTGKWTPSRSETEYFMVSEVDRHPITTPTKLRCNSFKSKEIMEVGGGGGAFHKYRQTQP